jgi:hypothetical protein
MRPGFRLILPAIVLCLIRTTALSAQGGLTLSGRVTRADGPGVGHH